MEAKNRVGSRHKTILRNVFESLPSCVIDESFSIISLSGEWGGVGKSRAQKVFVACSPLEFRDPTHDQSRYSRTRSEMTKLTHQLPERLTKLVCSWFTLCKSGRKEYSRSRCLTEFYFTKVGWVSLPRKTPQKADLGLNKQNEQILTIPSKCARWTPCHQGTHTTGWTQNCCIDHETLQGYVRDWTSSPTKYLRDQC